VETLDQIWREKIANSEKLKGYARERGALFAPASGAAAVEQSMPVVRANAWLLFDAGKAKVSPDTVGIQRP
jgi:hypothetical protein